MDDLPNYSTGGWGEDANCLVDDAGDVSFIREPTELEARRWRNICLACPVFAECELWSERLQVSGVFSAGQWRG